MWSAGGAAQARRAGRRRVAPVVGAIVLLVAVLAVSAIGPASAEVPLAATCAVNGPATESGSVLISRPMLPEITGSDLAIDPGVETVTPSAINPGQEVPASTTVSFDLAAIAQDVLENRVKPGVVAAGFPELAPSAWVELDLRSVRFSIRHPAGVTPVGVGAGRSRRAGGAERGPDPGDAALHRFVPRVGSSWISTHDVRLRAPGAADRSTPSERLGTGRRSG